MPTATTIQRQVSPIPPGRYWIDVGVGRGDPIADFQKWVRDMAGAVVVEHTEETPPPDISDRKIPRLLFVIFVVPPGRAPFLDAKRFGFPNFAPPEVRSSQDVFKAPVVKTPLDDGVVPFLRDQLPDDVGPAIAGAGLLILLVVLIALSGKR